MYCTVPTRPESVIRAGVELAGLGQSMPRRSQPRAVVPGKGTSEPPGQPANPGSPIP